MPLTAAEQSELDELEYQKLLSEKQASVAPAAKPPPTRTTRRLPAYMPGMEAPIMTEAATPEDVEASRAMTATGLRMAAVPVGVATGSLPLMALAGGLGEFGARRVEGRPLNLRQDAGAMTGNAIMSGAPIARAIPGPVLSGRGLLNAAIGAGQTGGTVAAANFIERGINKGEFFPYDNFKEAMVDGARHAALPAMLGSVTHGLLGKAGQRANDAEDMAKNAAALKAIGVENPSLGDLIPRYGAMQERRSALDPAIAAKVAQSRMPAAKAFYEMVGDAVSNEAVANQMQPLVSKMDALDAAYKQAADASEKAQLMVAKAKMDPALQPQQLSAILAGATEDELNQVAKMARAAREAQVVSNSIGTQTGKAEAMQGVVKNLYNARSRAADNMMAATGIAAAEPLFDKAVLVNAARSAMGDRATSDAGKKILKAIEESKQPPRLSDIPAGGQVTTSSPEESRQLLQQAFGNKIKTPEWAKGAPAAPQPQVLLSLSEFRQLRDKISDAFAGVPENTMRSAEQLASTAYAKMGEASKTAIGTRYGPEGLSKYNDFLSFWKKTSQLRDSDFGMALLRGEVADSTVAGMADRLAKGEVDELKNFKRFIEVVGAQEPEAAKMAMETMAGAVKNSFLEKATVGGQINYKTLAGSLADAAKKRDLPFPIETFGFGNAETIRDWNKVLGEFKASDITPKALEEIMSSRDVQAQLVKGGQEIAPRLRTILAAKAFNKRVIDANALMAAGKTASANAAYAEAAQHARDAKMDTSIAEKAVKEAMNDPVVSLFRGKGDYTFTNEAGRMTGAGTINDFLGGLKQAEGRQLLDALAATNPQTADMVRRRFLAGEFAHFYSPERGLPGESWKLDGNKVRAYFDPAAIEGQGSQAEKVRAIIGPELFGKFKSFANGLASLQDRTRNAIIHAKVPHEGVEAAGTAAAIGTGSLMRGNVVRGAGRRLLDQAENMKYNLLSAMITDKGFANAVYEADGDFAKAIGSLPTQKAVLLLADRQLQEELGQ